MSKAHPVDVHVGRRLRLRRTILGLSQDAIGSAIGVTFQQVQKYERGINRMSASRLHDFSKILKVNIGYFFDGYGEDFEDVVMGHAMGMAEPDAPAFEHNPISNRETMDVMRAYYRIKNPSTRKRLLDLIKAVADDKGGANI
jgi:transcriptional regulator with XRE-family HTH domain